MMTENITLLNYETYFILQRLSKSDFLPCQFTKQLDATKTSANLKAASKKLPDWMKIATFVS